MTIVTSGWDRTAQYAAEEAEWLLKVQNDMTFDERMELVRHDMAGLKSYLSEVEVWIALCPEAEQPHLRRMAVLENWIEDVLSTIQAYDDDMSPALARMFAPFEKWYIADRKETP